MNDSIEPVNNENEFRPTADIDENLQKEIDDALGAMSVEDLLNEQVAAAPTGDADTPAEVGLIARKVTPSGQKLYVSIVQAIDGDNIFVDLGGKSQGLLTTSQFDDDKLPNVGDEVEFTISNRSSDDGLVMLSRSGAVEAANWDSLEVGAVVAGTVTGHNKGGLEVKVNSIRAFMPISQVERFGGVDADALPDYVNQKVTATVMECRPRDKKLVISRRAYLDSQAAENRTAIFENLNEGDTVTGTVKTIMPYGAFIDLGGADGLLHVREMSYARINNPRDVVQEGMELSVKVISIDREAEKIGLSLKAAKPDPWLVAATNYHEGDRVSGTIVKLMDFGAFVALEDGIEGLIPVSELSFKRVHHPKEVVAEGQAVEVKVLSVDPSRQRMSLSLKQLGDDPWTGASARWAVGNKVTGTVMRTTDFGAFVQLAEGVEGLVHISELSDQHVKSVDAVVREGDSVEVRILDVNEETHRISLSMKAESEGSAASFRGKADGYVSRSEDTPAASTGMLNMGGVPDGGKGRRDKKKKPRKGGL
jgi:small subunit ribosomal protein S1